ncbi:oligosaccharide flippase family protein [Aeromonas sp. 95A]|uniref:oligosaccharide flippase family protein n=1 Tax=Aeromonas sp. 95A TaxID=3452729 RepID=UPI003F7A6184
MKKQINLSYGILNTIQNAIFPLVTLPYVLQTVGPELYGKNLHAALFHQLFSFLFILAINPYALRLFSHAIEVDKKIVEESVFSRIVSFQFIMSFIATIFQVFLITVLELLTPLYLLYTLITFFSFMNVEWLFQAKQDYRVIFFRTFIIRALVLLFLFILVKDESDANYYNIIMACSLILPAVISFALANKTYKIKLNFEKVKLDVIGAKYFYANGAIGSVYAYVGQVVIGFLVSGSELALLNIMKTIVSTIMAIPNMVNKFIMPDAFKAYRNGMLIEHHKKFFILMIVCLVLGLYIFHSYGLMVISSFLGEKVVFKQMYVDLICFSVVATSLAVYIDNQSSVIIGLEKITTLSNSIVAITGPLTAYFMYHLGFGFLSLFIGFTLGEFLGVLVMIVMHICVYKTNFCSRN